MFLSSRHSRSTPWLKYIPLLLLPVILLVGAMYVLGFVRITPPISAKAVDAVTGKPIPGMTVCLQAQDLGRHLLRSKMSRTGDSGRFLFSPSIYMGLLLAWRGYWIRVTDPEVQIAAACGDDVNQFDLAEAQGWPIDLGPNEHGRPKYFPVALFRGEPDLYVIYWGAMHRTMAFPLGARIALIPVLQNVNDCKQVADVSLSEDCRQLNTYAAAMSLRDKRDAESWTLADKLCGEVDHSTYSGMCKGIFFRITRSRQARESNLNRIPR